MEEGIGLNDLFYELIQVAIGERPGLSYLPSEREWGKLYKMAEKQSLIGVCFAGLQRLGADADEGFARIGINEMQYLTWMGMTAKIQQRNQTVDEQSVALQKLLSADGLRSSVLKGQGVGQLYAEHLRGLRQSGDIDVWIEGGIKNAMIYAVEKFCYVKFDYINAHLPVFEAHSTSYFDSSQYKSGEHTEVELHWRVGHLMSLPQNARFQRWVEDNTERITGGRVTLADGSELIVPDVSFNRVYVLLHIFNHEFSEGIGLRQLMDYSFVLRQMVPTEEEKIDFKAIISSFGMYRFAKAVMWIMQRVFAVPEAHLMCEADEKEGAYILGEVMQNGNFGHHDKRVRRTTDNRYLSTLSRSLQHNWHLASHYPSMIFWSPVWYIYHFFWKRMWKMSHRELFKSK